MGKCRVIAVLAVVLMVSLPTIAQLRRIGTMHPGSEVKIPVSPVNVASLRKVLRRAESKESLQSSLKVEDTVYSAGITKRHGWHEPLTIITKEQASRRNSSYRFTGRNPEGHFTKVESINSLGDYTSCNLTPYIANIFSSVDSASNTVWKNRIATSCIFEMISDLSGKNVIQERVYDKDHKLVYSFSTVPVGDNVFIGSYKDINGLPAEMRTEPGYSFGTLVMITRDDRGFERRVEFVDSKGTHKPNADGAYATLYEFDDAGRRISQFSVDENGEYIIDNVSNCGMLVEWDEKRNVPVVYTAVDTNLEPIKLRTNDGDLFNGVSKYVVEYDENFNEISTTFVNPDGSPAFNRQGIHKVEYYPNKFGLPDTVKALSIAGTLVPFDASGTAMRVSVYDSLGRNIEVKNYNSLGEPLAGEQNLWRIRGEYSPEGEQTGMWQYSMISGTEKSAGSYQIRQLENGMKEMRTDYADGTYQIVLNDAKGRTIRDEICDVDGSPLMAKRGFATGTLTITETPNGTISVQEWFDENGNPCVISSPNSIRGVDKVVNETDSVAMTGLNKSYLNGELVDIYLSKFNKNGIVTGQYDVNRFGVKSRAGGSSGVRVYDSDAQFSPFSELNSIVGIDEFGEPDYVVPYNGIPYVYQRFMKGATEFKMEDDKSPGEDLWMVREELPKIMTIEVTDSLAYSLGLKDNDLILKYGNYYPQLGNYSASEKEFVGKWVIRNLLESDSGREMIVFRIEDAKAGKYGIVNLGVLPAGTSKELGFVPHVRYLTSRQKERIEECIEEHKDLEKLLQFDEIDWLDRTAAEKYVIIDFPSLYRNELDGFYAREVGEAAMLLAAYDGDHDKNWTPWIMNLTDPLNEVDFQILPVDATTPKRDYFFTSDGRNIIHAPLTERNGDFNLYEYGVTDEEYDKLKPIFDEAAKKAAGIRKEKSKFKVKDLEGFWVVEDSDNVYSPAGYLYLGKDGRCSGEITGFTTIPEMNMRNFPGKMTFSKTMNFEGTWKSNGKRLIVFSPENDPTYVCVGYEPTYQETMMMQMNSMQPQLYPIMVNAMLQENSQPFIFSMHAGNTLDRFVEIISVDKNEMILSGSHGGRIKLIKQNKKPEETE